MVGQVSMTRCVALPSLQKNGLELNEGNNISYTSLVPISSIFQKLFGEVYGLPCWNVKPGYGSSLTLEFGQPHSMFGNRS